MSVFPHARLGRGSILSYVLKEGAFLFYKRYFYFYKNSQLKIWFNTGHAVVTLTFKICNLLPVTYPKACEARYDLKQEALCQL